MWRCWYVVVVVMLKARCKDFFALETENLDGRFYPGAVRASPHRSSQGRTWQQGLVPLPPPAPGQPVVLNISIFMMLMAQGWDAGWKSICGSGWVWRMARHKHGCSIAQEAPGMTWAKINSQASGEKSWQGCSWPSLMQLFSEQLDQRS